MKTKTSTVRKSTIGCRTDICFHVKVHGKSKNDIEKLTHDMKTTWNPQLKHYFEKQIEPKIEKFASPYVPKYTKLDKFSGVTTNQSEGFNWLMKDLTN